MAKAGKKHRVKTIENIDTRVVEEKLLKARISLLIRHPFFGNLATRLMLQEASWCETAATDGRNFFYNPSFIMSLSVKELEFLFAHEVLHNAFEHLLRKDNRDALLFNVAADYAINQILVDEKIGKFIKNGLLDEKYRGMAAEEIYDILYENADKIDLQDLLDSLLDDHLDGKDDGDQDDGKGDGDGKRRGSGRPKLSDADKEKIRAELKAALLQAASSVDAGSLPGGLARLVEGLTAPKLSWKDILRNHIQSSIKSDYTFMTPAKKSMGTPFRLPGMKRDETIDICVGIDCSGSIDNNTLREMLSEVQGIMSQYTDYKIHVWSYDTEVNNPVVYRADEGGDASAYEPMGGGGTNFIASYKFMEENDIVPNTYINFTDGYCDGAGFGWEQYCDTVFCITKNGIKNDAPFGTTVRLD